MAQLAADCALLEELRVMDYSLLLGVHCRTGGWTSSPPVTDRVRLIRHHGLPVAHTCCWERLQGMGNGRVQCLIWHLLHATGQWVHANSMTPSATRPAQQAS